MTRAQAASSRGLRTWLQRATPPRGARRSTLRMLLARLLATAAEYHLLPPSHRDAPRQHTAQRLGRAHRGPWPRRPSAGADRRSSSSGAGAASSSSAAPAPAPRDPLLQRDCPIWRVPDDDDGGAAAAPDPDSLPAPSPARMGRPPWALPGGVQMGGGVPMGDGMTIQLPRQITDALGRWLVDRAAGGACGGCMRAAAHAHTCGKLPRDLQAPTRPCSQPIHPSHANRAQPPCAPSSRQAAPST
jgi:hypothetical protein